MKTKEEMKKKKEEYKIQTRCWRLGKESSEWSIRRQINLCRKMKGIKRKNDAADSWEDRESNRNDGVFLKMEKLLNYFVMIYFSLQIDLEGERGC